MRPSGSLGAVAQPAQASSTRKATRATGEIRRFAESGCRRGGRCRTADEHGMAITVSGDWPQDSRGGGTRPPFIALGQATGQPLGDAEESETKPGLSRRYVVFRHTRIAESS